MTHTALEKVPATIGESVELRCTKILEKSSSDYYESSICDPEYSTDCYHSWSKDGVELTTNGSDKYSVKTQITFDYCANFEWTTDLVNKFGFIDEVDDNNYYSRDMKCYSSGLVINNVQDSDFGIYTCNFAYHNDRNQNPDDSEIQNITLYDSTSSEQQPVKVEYYEIFYAKGIRSKLLMQCVVTGGPLNWFVRTETEDCPRWSSGSCVNNKIIKIEKLAKADQWRCYKYSIESHTPHEGITESFIYFQNICAIDWGSVFCAADETGTVKSESGYITQKSEWNDYYYYRYYHSDEALAVGLVVALPLLSVLLIVASIMACVRGKMCVMCCYGRPQNMYSQPVNYMHVPPQMQFVQQPQVFQPRQASQPAQVQVHNVPQSI